MIVKSRMLQWPVHVDRVKETRNANVFVVEKTFVKQLHGKTRRRREDNVNLKLPEICCEDKNCMKPPQDHVQCRSLISATLNLKTY